MFANIVVWGIFGILLGRLDDILCKAFNTEKHAHRHVYVLIILLLCTHFFPLLVPIKVYSIIPFTIGIVGQTVISTIRKQ